MDQFFDQAGQLLQSTENFGGQHIVRNAAGQIVKTFHPTAGGGHWSDSFGHVVEHVRTVGDTVQHLSPSGQIISSTSVLGNQTLFQNTMGQTLTTFDPMTGNVSDAIGQVFGFVRQS